MKRRMAWWAVTRESGETTIFIGHLDRVSDSAESSPGARQH